MKKFFLLLACVALLPLVGNATVLTVGPGGFPTYDYASIQAAIDAANHGDTIQVAAGLYNAQTEGAVPGQQGLINVTKGVVIIAAPGVRPVIDGTTVDGVFKIHPSALLPGNTVRIEGMEITGDPATGIAMTMQACYDVTPAEVVIRDNWFHGMIGGINFWGASAFLPFGWTSGVVNVTISENRFYDLGVAGSFFGFGIFIEGAIDWINAGNDYAVKITGNEFGNIHSDHTNPGAGAGIDGSHANMLVDSNLFNDIPLSVGIQGGDVTHTRISNNRFLRTSNAVFSVFTLPAFILNAPIDASENYWGSVEPDFNAINIGDVAVCDYYTDAALTNLSCPPVINISAGKVYYSIQDAIDNANPGDTIRAGTGTYNENVEIDVPRLVLTNASSPIIEGIGDDIVVHITADSVTLDGFTITNAGLDPGYAGVLLSGVKGVKIQNCSILKNYSTGLALLGSDSNYVLNNIIDTNYVAGVGLVASSHNTFTGNIIRANRDIAVKNGALGYGIVIDQLDFDPYNCGGDVNSQYNVFSNNDVLNNDVDGIYVGESCDSNVFIGNTISGNGDNGLYLWKSGQNTVRSNTISLNENCGLQLMGSPGNEIVGNSVLDNNQSGGSENAGIKVRSGNIQVCSVWVALVSDTNVIDSNIISGNDAYGVLFEDNPGYTDDDHLMLNADLNYWGNPNGPSGAHFGTGDTVSTRVLFCPWLIAPPPAGIGMGPVFNISQQTGHCSIQDAIDAASPGDTIEVWVGPYHLSSPVRITQSVYLRGIPGRKSLVVVNAPTTGTDRDVFQVLADDVTIDGFQIQGAHDVSGSAMGRTNAGIAVGGDYFILGARPAGATDFTFDSWWALSVDNTVIKNNYITNNSYGIFLFHATNATISNNDISGNIYNGDTTTMWNGKGIQIYTSQDMTDDNLAVGGTGLPHSLNILIDSNDISENKLFGIELNHAESWNGGDDGPYDVNIVISNNVIGQNGSANNYPWGTSDLYRGISANGNEKNVTVSGNHIYGHTTGGNFNEYCAGIRIRNSNDWSITRNTIDRNFRGIYAYGTSIGINVTDSNAIFDNAQGVVMASDTTGLIKGNMIYHNDEIGGLSGITDYGVLNLGTGMLDASPNWWGHSSGPYHPKLNPCGLGDRVSDSVDFDPWYIDQALTKNGGVPIVSDASLISSRDVVSWEGLGGDFANGFELCLHPQQPYYYLDIQSLIVSAGLDSTDFEQNAFFLDTNNLPVGFYDYWDTVRGVDGNNNAGGWELAMWYIIQGDEPMFYIRYDNQDYDLIDGLQYELGQGTKPLRINGDYPLGTYTFFGSVRDTNGSCSDTFDVEITFHPTPDVFFEVDAVPLLPYDSLVYCFDVDEIILTLVNTQLGQPARGTAPFMIEFTVDNGTPVQLTGVQYDDEIDLLDYLPPGPYPGQTAAGIYEIQVTDFADANGCGLVPEAIIYYNFKITINPQPDAFFEVDGTPLQPFDSLVYCFDVDEIILSLVDEQLGQPAIGTPPYMIEFTVDGGAPVQLTGVQYDDEIDLLDYLPAGPYPGQTAAGIYEIVVSDFADSNGCTLVPNAMAYYRFKVTINPQPDAFFEVDGTPLQPFDSLVYCFDVPEIILSLVDEQLGQAAIGTPPYMIEFTVDGGAPVQLTGVQYEDEIDLLDYLPAGPYPGQTAAGIYEIVVTDFADSNGCTLVPNAIAYYRFKVTINPQPDAFFEVDGTPLQPFDSLVYCFDVDEIILSLVDEQLGQPAIGTPPYMIEFTVDGGAPVQLTGVQYDDEIDLLDYLPQGPYPGQTAAGIYEIVVTDFADSNGCTLVPNAMAYYRFKVTINPQPDAFFEVDGTPLQPFDSLVYCFDVDEIILSLVDEQLGQLAIGTPPYMIEFTVDGGAPVQLTGVQYEDEIDLLDYLPGGPYPVPTDPGLYEIQVTHFEDANGCTLVPNAIQYYRFKVRILPEPDVFFEIDGNALLPFDTVEYCRNVDAVMLGLVAQQGGVQATGDAPFFISFTVVGGAMGNIPNVEFNDVLNLKPWLPQDANGLLPGDHLVYVTSLTDSNGCQIGGLGLSYYRFVIRVHSLPSVSLVLPTNQLCKNATGLLLSGGTPAGGTYSGTGVSNNVFFPALVPAGTYTITYTYQDEHNCINTATDQMTVLALPVVNFSPIPDVCEDQAYLILNQGSPAGGTYGGVYMKGDTFDVAAAGPGTYNLTYHYQDGNGCINWKAQSITVHPLPVLACPADQEVCEDEPPFALGGATPAGGTYSGAGVNAGAFDASLAGTGNHLITYTFADSNGCVNTCSYTITVYPLPVVQCPADFSLCADAGPYILSGASPSGGVYGGTGVSNGKFYASTAGVGSHTITYSYTDANGCNASCTFTITVHPLPVAAIQASDTELCEGECATLTASGGDTYLWSNAASTAQQQVCPTQSTTYTVTVTDANGCRDVAQIAIMVHPAPPVNAGADQSVCLLEGAQLLASGAHSYAWSTGEHTAGITVSPKITATYTVTGTDANGCTASDAVVVTILPLPELSIVAVDEVCYGECIILNASGAQTYSWSDGGSGSPYTYCPVNSDSITLTGTGANGCTATEVHSYTVLDLPVVDAGVDTSIFIGQSYLFDANASGVAPLSYLWSPALALDDATLLNPEATPIMTEYYVLAVTDGNGCVGSDQFLLEVKPQGNSISGQVVYGNTQQTPLEGFEVVIQSQGAKYADTVYTGPNGLFSLSNIPAGTYAIGGNSTQPWGWGGVNATDALNILLHTVFLDTLTGIWYLAADIDAGGFVNATDALNVALRFAGLPNNFTADWIMETDTFFLDYEELFTRQYLALVLGDVNASNVFNKALVPNGRLLLEGSIPLSQGVAVRIPLYCKEDVLAGALSMSLRIPEGLQIEDVQLAEGVGGHLVHNVVDGQLRLAWYDVGGSLLNPGQEMLNIVAQSTGFVPTAGFRLGSELELSDAAGKIIADAVFTMPELITGDEAGLQLSAWPNPARDAMQIRYDLPVDGKVLLKIYDARGALVRVAAEAAQAAGSHTIALDVSNLAAGSYVAELVLESDGTSLTARQKLVVLR